MVELDHRSDVTSPPGILKRLKLETRACHLALERQLPLMDPTLSQAAYRHFVGRFYGFYAPLEARLEASTQWDECEFDYQGRYKTQRLALDLKALRVAPEEVNLLPQCQDLPALGTASQLLGCLYVMEGATLGGQVISRHLQAHLGVAPDSGGAFFAGYGLETGMRWKSFCVRLHVFAQAVDAQDALIASANQTFASLQRWLFPAAPHGAGRA
jgi:heme oxygenase